MAPESTVASPRAGGPGDSVPPPARGAATLRRSLPALLMAGVLVLLPVAFGASLAQSVLYLLDEAFFALLPGVATLLALSPAARRRGPLEALCLGYALGLALQIGAFAFTAAIGLRALLWAYPVIALALGALTLVRAGEPRRLLRPPPSAPGAGWRWGLAAVALAVMGLVAAGYFPGDPLPAAAGSVSYIPDLVFHLGVAAEALHHWPITDPKVSGTPLPYELFVYMKLAASAQTSHIALPAILFRLYILPLVLEVVGLLFCAGRRLSGRPGAGIAAAALFLLVGQLGLDPRDPTLFFNTVFFSLYDSPTYTLGLVFLLALLLCLADVLAPRPPHRREWVLLLVLLLAASGAKATVLPDLIGGLALLPAAALAVRIPPLRARGWTLPPAGQGWLLRCVAALSAAAAVFLLSDVVLYRMESGGLSLHPPGSIRAMGFTALLFAHLPGLPAALEWLLATLIGLLGFAAATLAGLPAALRRARAGAPGFWLALAVLAVSFVPFLLLVHKGGSQNFFTYYGLAAGSLLSGAGLDALFRASRLRPAVAVAAAAAWLAALLTAAILPYHLGGAPGEAPLLVLWLGLPALALAVLAAIGWRSARRRPCVAAAAAAALALCGLLDTPLHLGRVLLPALLQGRPLHAVDSPAQYGLTPGLQRALTWVRGHVPPDAVLAVNNQWSDAARTSPTFYVYSAFGERRVFLEGWLDTVPDAAEANGLVCPFPRRLALNDALFGHGDLGALAVMERRYGVRYLLVDEAHGPVPPGLPRLGRVVYADRAAIILRARPLNSGA